MIAVALCLCSACSRPPPDDVVAAMLADVAAKRYSRALRYCGPRVHAAYSNHLYLTTYHANLCESTTYTVGPAHVTGDTAYVTGELAFDVKNERVYVLPVRFDLWYDGRWIVDDVWRTAPDGRLERNILDNLPGALY
jgi:hypothetical protein